jgi:hypothetical protein
LKGPTLFGLFAVTAMLVTYALEARSARFILAFALACALGSVYGLLQGAWPFGVVEAICCGVAFASLVGQIFFKLAGPISPAAAAACAAEQAASLR